MTDLAERFAALVRGGHPLRAHGAAARLGTTKVALVGARKLGRHECKDWRRVTSRVAERFIVQAPAA